MGDVKLIRYEAARNALAEAQSVDEVKGIRDKMMAMQIYAVQAKDLSLINAATELRLRAEIRGGELLKEMAEKSERAGSSDTLLRGRAERPRETPTLKDLGVTKSQSSRWQQLAALTPAEQDERIANAKVKASAAIENAGRPKPAKPERATPAKSPAKRAHMSQIDLCTLDVRDRVLKAMDALQPEQWPELFVELRDELEHLESAAERRRKDEAGWSPIA
jgi:hypothetical protein